MSIVYDYVVAVWLELDLPGAGPDFAEELEDYLLEAGFQINELDIIEDDEDRADSEVTVSLRVQLTFDESQMDDDEPTEEALGEFDDELRACLSAKYDVTLLEVLDDSPHSHLLSERDDADLA